MELTKLGLHLPSDPRWVNLTQISIEDILTDHAYCEQKAAISGISLIQAYPEHVRLVDEITPVVAEEWGHFNMVYKELKKRGLPLGRQRKDEYVNKLIAFQKKGIHREEKLIERLLTFAMIEARSCERFRLLSIHLEDEYLRKFYHHFMVSEAGHYKLFLSLAREYGGEEIAMKRWQEYLSFEANMVEKLEVRGDRMH